MNTYFSRYAYQDKLFPEKPASPLHLSVVIPCYNEPNIIPTLESLQQCVPVTGTEVIVIVNEPAACRPEIHRQNRVTLQEIARWRHRRALNFNLLVHHLVAPAKTAGVGYARKVGMDEAARRFEEAGNRHGVICCFDADSTCDKNYLTAIYEQFYLTSPRPHGAAVYYEHPYPADSLLREGISQYELHLRYYVNALRYVGYPFAHHTIGSTMVVRSDMYQKIGGMNKRQAGEDFYFLHKLMPMGAFIELNNTTVYPAGRVSDRVPFGTGKAMGKWLQGNSPVLTTYNLQSFTGLKQLFARAEDFYRAEDKALNKILAALPESGQLFLREVSFSRELARLKRQSKTVKTFVNNWYRFFDGFMVLRYLHFVRDHFYPDQPVVQEARKLAALRWPTANISNTAGELLTLYRQQDKGL